MQAIACSMYMQLEIFWRHGRDNKKFLEITTKNLTTASQSYFLKVNIQSVGLSEKVPLFTWLAHAA